MKKVTFLLAILMATTWVSAQTIDSIHNHMAGHYCLCPHDAIQLADGNILIMARQDSLTTHDNTQQVIPHLTKFYKISRYGAEILDSITFDTTYSYIQMARPYKVDNDYGNIIMCLTEENIMNIKFFDDDLNFNDEMEVSFPIADTSVHGRFFLLDRNNDIILNYFAGDSTYFARFGLDGTLKHAKAYHRDMVPNVTTPCPTGQGYRVDGLKQYGSNPLGYNYFGILKTVNWGEGNCWGFELDSLFNIAHQYELHDSDPAYPYYTHNPYSDVMLSQGDGMAYFIRNVRLQPSIWGTVIQKVDENNEIINSVKFGLCPRPYNQVKAIDMEKDKDGNICYAFFGLDMDSCHYVATVKVDSDLNIIWERYALRMQAPYQEFMHEPRGMKVLDDGAVLVYGFNHAYNWDYYHINPNNEPWLYGLFLTLMYEEIQNVAEEENVLRPYLFYPNPVHEQLYLHFSPDVTPKQIELYDLQGRLVKTQRNGLESLNLESLSAGTYTMRVTLEDGKVFSDKVVKE